MSKEEFVADLYAFMQRIGQPITKTPFLGYQELDLHRLFHIVQQHGGADEVSKKQEWKLVYQELEIPTMSTSASYNTRTNYKKYLYLYELEHLGTAEERLQDAPTETPTHPPRFEVGDWVRIESSTFAGQVFYAQVQRSRFRDASFSHYVHYNGWSTSHDEWMPEAVLQPLRPEERTSPHLLNNPPPTRSSKSNYLIYDPTIGDRPQHQYPKEREDKRKKKVKKEKPSRASSEVSDTISVDESEAIESLAAVSKEPTRPSRSLRLRLKQQQEPMKPTGFLGPNWAIVRDELNNLEMDGSLCVRRRGETVLMWGQVQLGQSRKPVISISEEQLANIGLEFPTVPAKRQHRARPTDLPHPGNSEKADPAYLKDRRSIEDLQISILSTDQQIREMEEQLSRLNRQLDRQRRTNQWEEKVIITPPPSSAPKRKRK